MIYWIATIGIFITNLPFGYWRTNVKRYSMSWIAAIHLPVLMIITFRVFSSMGFQLFTFPLFAGLSFRDSSAVARFIHGEKYALNFLSAAVLFGI